MLAECFGSAVQHSCQSYWHQNNYFDAFFSIASEYKTGGVSVWGCVCIPLNTVFYIHIPLFIHV